MQRRSSTHKKVAGTTYVSTPVITSKTDDYGIEDGALELNCSVEYNIGTKIEMKWMLPNNNIAIEVRKIYF